MMRVGTEIQSSVFHITQGLDLKKKQIQDFIPDNLRKVFSGTKCIHNGNIHLPLPVVSYSILNPTAQYVFQEQILVQRISYLKLA